MWIEDPRNPAPVILALAAIALGVVLVSPGHRAVAAAIAAPIVVRDTGFDMHADYSDGNILGLLNEANQADSIAGEYAASRATSTAVRTFAQRMMTDHHRMGRSAREAGEALHIKLDLPSKDPIKPAVDTGMATLRSTAPGALFDKAYIDQEIQMHKTMLDLTQAFRASTKNQAIKDLINRATPTLTQHLKEAEALLTKAEPKT